MEAWDVSLARRALVVRLLVVVIVFLMLGYAGTARAALSWSGPSAVDPGAALVDVACPSATQCTAVDSTGHEVTYDPASPGTPTRVAVATTETPTGIACPSTTECTILGWHERNPYTGCPSITTEETFNPQAAGPVTPVVLDDDPNCDQLDNSDGIACPSTTECVGIESTYYASAKYVTFNPASPGTPRIVAFPCNRTVGCIDTGYSGDTIVQRPSCASATECVVVSNFGYESQFNPQSSSGATLHNLNNAAETSLACPSATECVAGSYAGESTFDPASPGSPVDHSLTGETGAPFDACPSTTYCIFVQANVEAEGNPQTSSWITRTISISAPTGIACPSATECVAIDNTGHSYTGTAPSKASIGKPTVSGRTVKLPVACSGSSADSCAIKATLTRKKVGVGKTTTTLHGGQQKIVKVTLNKAGKALLKELHKLKTKLTVTRTVGGKRVLVATRTVTFKK